MITRLAISIIALALGLGAGGGCGSDDDGGGGEVPECAHSSSWVSVDRYTETGAEPGARAIAADPEGLLFAVGSGTYGGASVADTAAVRKSSDGGASWSVAYARSPITTETSLYRGAAIGPEGLIYAVGEFAGASKTWITTVSTSNGGSWASGGGFAGETFQYASNQNSLANSVDVGSDGTAWVAGMGGSVTGNHWVVRKGASRGVSWSTSDDYQLEAGSNAMANAILVAQDGAIYVTGNAVSNGIEHWVTRKSSDGGATWQKVDDLECAGGCEGATLVESKGGVVLAAGYHESSGGARHWVVRTSSDEGATWAEVDDFVLESARDAQAAGAGVDPFGNLYVAGFAEKTDPLTSIGVNHWIVRRSADGGSTWETVDDFLDEGVSPSTAYGVVADQHGNVYVTGNGFDASAGYWVTRKLACE